MQENVEIYFIIVLDLEEKEEEPQLLAMSRLYDLTIFGATGFTGAFVCVALAKLPQSTQQCPLPSCGPGRPLFGAPV